MRDRMEGKLRDDLRDSWKPFERSFGLLAWVEAARGGTFGNADVFLPVRDGGFVALELKHWHVDLLGRVAFTARPAQRRFHRMNREAGNRTAFLASTEHGKIVLLRGDRLPADRYPPEEPKIDLLSPLILAQTLRAILGDGEYWQ